VAFLDTGHLFQTDLANYRVHYFCRSAAGVGQTGLIPTTDIWRVGNAESPAAAIVTAGAGRTIVEPDATNVPGLYELVLVAGEMTFEGAFTLYIEGGGTAEPIVLSLKLIPREAWNTG